MRELEKAADFLILRLKKLPSSTAIAFANIFLLFRLFPALYNVNGAAIFSHCGADCFSTAILPCKHLGELPIDCCHGS